MIQPIFLLILYIVNILLTHSSWCHERILKACKLVVQNSNPLSILSDDFKKGKDYTKRENNI